MTWGVVSYEAETNTADNHLKLRSGRRLKQAEWDLTQNSYDRASDQKANLGGFLAVVRDREVNRFQRSFQRCQNIKGD